MDLVCFWSKEEETATHHMCFSGTYYSRRQLYILPPCCLSPAVAAYSQRSTRTYMLYLFDCLPNRPTHQRAIYMYGVT